MTLPGNGFLLFAQKLFKLYLPYLSILKWIHTFILYLTYRTFVIERKPSFIPALQDDFIKFHETCIAHGTAGDKDLPV